MQAGFFDWQNRFEKLDKTGDQLLKLTTAIKCAGMGTKAVFKALIKAL